MRNVFVILIILTLFGCFNCQKEEELNNKPIDIPEYVCYALFRAGEDNSAKDYIVVIDTQKDSVLGIHQVSKKGEWVVDFCLYDDRYLFFILQTSSYVRKFDAEKGEIIGELKTPAIGGGSILSIPNDEAFIVHGFKISGDSACVNSVIDLKSFTYRKKLITNLGGAGYDELAISPDSEVWVYKSRLWTSPFYPHNMLVKFYPDVDTLGEVLEFEDQYNGDRIRVDAFQFLSNEKLYAKCTRVKPDENEEVEHCVVVYKFPSLQILRYIPLPLKMVGAARSLLTIPNNKIYVSYSICSGQDGHRIDDKYIYVFDGTNDEFLKKMDCGIYGPFLMTYLPSLNKVYVFSAYEKKISVIDPNTDEVLKILKFGEGEIIGTRIIANK